MIMSKVEREPSPVFNDDEAQWRKVFHGELAIVDDEVSIDAETIRNYLILRDEAIAVNSIAVAEGLNTVSKEEARAIYQQASAKIISRGKKRWPDFFRIYGVGFLVGGFSVAILFLGFGLVKSSEMPSVKFVDTDGLNYAGYQMLRFNEAPGAFPNMLLIAGGSINIGCAKGWDDVSGGCRPTEFPSHSVTVKTFEMSQHEVTVGQYAKFVESTKYITDAEKEGNGCVHRDNNAKGQPFVMNKLLSWRNPSYEQNNSYPVTCVSWHDAQAYVAWLSRETKTIYRLPSEAEWEYAARGGRSTAYFWGAESSNNQANYEGVGGQDQWEFASPVGRFPANNFLLQDTAGNLWEWVQDCWHDNYNNAPENGIAWESNCHNSKAKVRRGGAWDVNATGIRSAIRSPGPEHDRSNLYGFRVARDWGGARSFIMPTPHVFYFDTSFN